MVKIPKEVRNAITNSENFTVATSDKNGNPNIIYIGFFRVLDDERISIADTSFNKTRSNIQENPRLALVTIDKESKKAYQVKGRVELKLSGEEFDYLKEKVRERMPELTLVHAVILHAEEVYNGAEKLA